MPESVGKRLKQAREERNLSIEKVAQLTRIRVSFIQALEADDYSTMSSAAQARGFLRNYSNILGMNIDEILAELQRAQTPIETEHLSGPLPSVDNASPFPVQQDEEKPARPFWASWLGRHSKTESALEPIYPEPVPIEEPVSQTPAATLEVESVPLPEPVIEDHKIPKPRGRKKEIDSEGSKPKRAVKRKPALSLVEGEKESESQQSVVELPASSVAKEPVIEEINAIKTEDAPQHFVEERKPSLLSRLRTLFHVRVGNPNQQTTVSEEESFSVQADEVKAEDETLRADGEQVEVQNEADAEGPNPSLLARVTALFRIRLAKPNPKEEAEEVSEVVLEPVKPTPELPQQSAEEIFAEVGVELRKRRDLLSLTVEEVERHTHMRAVFVKAMEEGNFDKLPSPVQTRGMLSNYAEFLGLDADALLLRFADALQVRRRMKYPDKPAGSKPPMEVVSSLPLLRSFIAGDLLFGIFVITMLFALAIWGVGRMIAIQTAEQALPTAPSIPQVLAGSTQAANIQAKTLIPAVDTPIPLTQDGTASAELPTLAANINVQLNIVAMERTFMRVIVDGEVKFDGRVLPGTAYPYEAENQVDVLTGNGAALRITYNGRDLGLLGSYGEVVDRVYTAAGVATPTATLPPTPTNTPPATPTLSITETPLPTYTPTITVTP